MRERSNCTNINLITVWGSVYVRCHCLRGMGFSEPQQHCELLGKKCESWSFCVMLFFVLLQVGLNTALVGELNQTSRTRFPYCPCRPLILHLRNPLSMFSCNSPSTPTSCWFMCCTILQTVTNPSTSLSDMDKLFTTHCSLVLICGNLNCRNYNAN